MIEVKIINPDQKNLFNQLAPHPIQSWEWGEFRQKQGHQVVRFGLFEKEKLQSVFQVVFHKIPQTKFTIGHLAQCDLVTPEVVNELKKIGQEKKAIFIKVEPAIVLPEKEKEEEETKLKSFGLVPGKPIFIRATAEVDLTKSEEELLKSFKSKTRYNIRLAEKYGVIVQEDNSENSFNNFLNLLFETTKRQGFYAHNKDFHRKQWQILHPAEISHLLTATYKEQILSAFLVFVFNNVIYYPYGASTREHREVMAPTLLMWEAMKFGKKLGCTKFDLWGDIDVNTLPPTHPYHGFHRFKEGFSPNLVKLIASRDLVIKPGYYKLYNLLDRIRWKILRLKSKLS